MNQHIFGVLGSQGQHIDVSNSERGAKNYATRNGYKEVTIRYGCGYNAAIIARKIGEKWEAVA